MIGINTVVNPYVNSYINSNQYISKNAETSGRFADKISAWYQSTCIGGSLIITEEAFEKMKCHERTEEILEEQIAKTLQRYKDRNKQLEGDYAKQLYQRQKNAIYSEGIQSVLATLMIKKLDGAK